MESFEYWRVTSSPAAAFHPGSPQPGSPSNAAAGSSARTAPPLWASPAAALPTPSEGTSADAAAGQGAWELTSSEAYQDWECASPSGGGGGGWELAAAGECFAREAAAAIQHSGWLLKASGRGPARRWRRVWVYLKADRLCYTDDPGGAASSPGASATTGSGGSSVRYVPLDRIPVRPLPRGYGPKIAVTLVDHRQVGTGRRDVATCCTGTMF